MLNIVDFVNAIHKEFDLNMSQERALKEYKDFLLNKCDFRYNNFDYILQNFDMKPLISKSEIDDISPKKHFHILHLLRSVYKDFDESLMKDVFEKDDVDKNELVKFMPTNTYENSFPFNEMRDIQTGIFSRMKSYLDNPKITDIIIDAPTGCVDSDTTIRVNRGKNGYSTTIKEEWLRQENKEVVIGRRLRNNNIPTFVRGLVSNNSVGSIKSDGIIHSGFKKCIKLISNTGKYIILTPDHRIYCDGSWIEAQYMLNKKWMVDSHKPLKSKNKVRKLRDTYIGNLKFHPFAKYVNSKKDGRHKRIVRYRAIYEANKNNLSLEEFKKILRTDEERSKTLFFLDPKYCIHHKDHDHYNDNPCNLEATTQEKHSKYHSVGAHSNFSQGVLFEETVVSIEDAGIREVFDVVNTPSESFTANDIVIHNCGKSGIAIASLLKERSGYLVTANKALQNQYANEFGWLADLRGKSNYKCRHHEGYNCKNSPCQKTKESREGCKEDGGCDYGATKRRVLKTSNYSLMNMHTLIAYSVYVSNALSKRDILVIDEAHSLPEVISSSVGLTLQLKSLIPFGINNIPVFSKPEAYSSWLSSVLEVLGDEDELDEDDEQLVHKIEVIKEQLGSGNIALDFERDKDNKDIVITLKLYPIRVEEYFEKIRGIAPIRIHLSATILGYQTYCSMLGIKEENVGIIRANSPFQKESRPIYINHAVGSINMQNLSYVMPRIVSNIEHLMEHYKDYKGIIHGVTYNICNNIYGSLNPKYKSRVLFPRMAKEQSEMLNKHKESKNTILLSPSMTEGVDLKDDLSRFQILVKTPYPYLGDPILQKRKEIYVGYYEMLTATTIMQAYGRSVRNTEDWCHTFVLDDNFYRFICINRGIFPQWFIDGIVK